MGLRGKMETISEDEPTTLGESAEPSRPSTTTLKHKSDGRIIFPSQQVSDSERNDPFKEVFTVSDFLQEYAIPLIVGAFSAMILANADWGTYEYYFTSDRCDEAQKAAYAIAHPGGGTCHSERWTVLDAPIFGHSLTLHFLANDIVMCFHFGASAWWFTEPSVQGNEPSDYHSRRHHRPCSCLLYLTEGFYGARLVGGATGVWRRSSGDRLSAAARCRRRCDWYGNNCNLLPRPRPRSQTNLLAVHTARDVLLLATQKMAFQDAAAHSSGMAALHHHRWHPLLVWTDQGTPAPGPGSHSHHPLHAWSK